MCILYIYLPVRVVLTDNVFLLSSFFYIYLFIYFNSFNFYFFIYQFVELGIVRCMFPLSPAFAHTWIANSNILKASLFSISSFDFPFCKFFFSFRFLLLDAEKIKRTNKVFLPAVQSMFSLHVLCISWTEHSLTMSYYCTKQFIHSDYSDLRTYIDNTWTSGPVVWSSHNKLGCHGNREMFRWMRMMISYSISTSR